MHGVVPKAQDQQQMKKVKMADRESREKLSSEEYHVPMEKGTEPPFAFHNKRKGVYLCRFCGNKLFESEKKYDSGTGWPSFFDVMKDAVELKPDEEVPEYG